MDIQFELFASVLILFVSLAAALLTLRATRILSHWIMLGHDSRTPQRKLFPPRRARVSRFETGADRGKIERAPGEFLPVAPPLKSRGTPLLSTTSDRRLTRREIEEIMVEPNQLWVRIGAITTNQPLAPDDRRKDNSS
jgi:hypothetical protein